MTNTKTRVQGKTVIKSELIYSGKGQATEVNSVIPAGAIKQKGIENKYLDARGYNPVKSEARKQEIMANITAIRAELRKVPATAQPVRSRDNVVYEDYEHFRKEVKVRRTPWEGSVKQALSMLDKIDTFVNSVFAEKQYVELNQIRQYQTI